MSQLSQFFPSGGGGTAINLVMVGGGGGGGAHPYSGAGGGGYFYGRVCIQPGVSYPVTIGAGGSPGCPTSCATTAGLGNPGSPSKFGKYEALGGGGGATICSSCTFAIMGGAGGSAGGYAAGPYDYQKFSLSASSQRALSPNGYCGAYGARIDGCNSTFIGTRTNTGTVVCPEFFGVCLASMPYTYCPASTLCCLAPYAVRFARAGCSRTYCCSSPYFFCCQQLFNYTNSAHGAKSPSCNGDSGVVLVAYPCALPAATAFPGATDCSPVSIPQNGFRTYKFTTSGSFTL